MNPSNPFGSPQSGAFQPTSNTIKTGLFQSFGQQNVSNQAQNMGFFPSPAFGQPSVLNQPPSHGNTTFGQGPSFGQPSTQHPAPPNQNPAFGQPTVGVSRSSFAPAFGQTSGPNQNSLFGQTPAFGQPSAFGQAPGFGQQVPGFGKQPSGFGNSPMASAPTNVGQPQPQSFGQSMFGPPSSTSVTTSVFDATQTQSRGFGTEFSFKPANEALFKPIFSASPETTNPLTTSLSSSPFGSNVLQTSSSTTSSNTTTGFSLLTAAQSGPLGFSFSQPAAAPSISAQNNPLTTGDSSGPTNTLQFTFSQPAAPLVPNTNASTTQPTTPSSFTFSTRAPQPQTTPSFGIADIGKPSAFGGISAKAETSADNKVVTLESTEDTNVFARLGKGTKRKEDTILNIVLEPGVEDDETANTALPRQPPKRPLMRSRGPTGGLFSRALTGLRKDVTNPVRREATETQQQGLELEDTEDTKAQDEHRTATPPAVQAVTREVMQEAEGSGENVQLIFIFVSETYLDFEKQRLYNKSFL